ncbi:uncharacterized protein F5147DRAFT_536185, partial [Suillus discolor]
KMDLLSKSEALTVTATVELPSLKQHIDVEAYGRHLTISGYLRRSEHHGKGGYTV